MGISGPLPSGGSFVSEPIVHLFSQPVGRGRVLGGMTSVRSQQRSEKL